MTTFDGMDLKAARIKANMSVSQAATVCCVSDRTILRWENNDVLPSPDDVDRLEKAYKAPGLWNNWMRYHYDSYAERFPVVNPRDLPLSVVEIRHQAKDVKRLQEEIERDAMSGSIDNVAMKQRYIKEARELLGSIIAFIDTVSLEEKNNG